MHTGWCFEFLFKTVCQSLQCFANMRNIHRLLIAYSHHFCICSNSYFQANLRERETENPNTQDIFLHLFFGWYLIPYGAKLMQSTITDIIWVRPSIIEDTWEKKNRSHQQSPEELQWQKNCVCHSALQCRRAFTFKSGYKAFVHCQVRLR